jgi:glycosyl transferase family 25
MDMIEPGIPAFFINLDRATERCDFMERQGGRLGLGLARIRALEPADIDDAAYGWMSRSWERPITRIEVAVLMSHAQLWERAAASDAGIVVLEDDAVLSPRFADFLLSPPTGEWDLVNLEWVGRRKYFRRSAADRTRPRITAVARDKAGAGAYFLSPAGARKLLAALATHAAPADAFMFRNGRLRIGQAEPALAIQAHILAAEGIEPGIRTVTQIHQPRERLPLFSGTMMYRARRVAAQLGLVRYQLGRLGPVVLRLPEIDFDEFRRAVEPESGGQAGSSSAQSER